MVLQNLSFIKGSRTFWFVLSSSSLSWYKDEDERELQFILPLEGLRLRDIDNHGFMSKRDCFALFKPTNTNIYKEYRQLELGCESRDESDSWKASFLRAGVYPEKHVVEEETATVS